MTVDFIVLDDLSEVITEKQKEATKSWFEKMSKIQSVKILSMKIDEEYAIKLMKGEE